jgi:hypothetical protein
VSTKSDHLKDFYLYAYNKSKSSPLPSIPVSVVGHGAFDLNNFKKTVTVFQYYHVNPVLSQVFKTEY